MVVSSKGMTAEEFCQLPQDDTFQELIWGEVHTSPPPFAPHGLTSGKTHAALAAFLKTQELGALMIHTGFCVERDPDTVLAPDLSFVRTERLEPMVEAGYSDLVPDLVVEVVSPSDSARAVDRRMREWLRLGARLGWAANPKTQSISVYRPGTDPLLLRPGDILDGADVLPGFSCPIRDLFA